MKSSEIRQKFLDFFAKRGHAIVKSSSLVPDDPSVLLTTAGMQQFKKYYTGELDARRDFGSLNTASSQKSFRTSDIDEVGDERHLTFFEMLGNFSFGGYFKKEAIEYAHEFITKEMGLEISYVTVFKGLPEIGVPKDEESITIWRSLGVDDVREEGMADVFWGPTGSAGPCGPTTEIYCKNGAGQDIEVWNIVFNQFFFSGSREELESGLSGNKLEPLKTPGVDTGMGLERLVMSVQETATVFETDLFASIIGILPSGMDSRVRCVIADHIRGSVFLIGDGVRPSNKAAGYILRRLLRRIITYEHMASFNKVGMYAGGGIGSGFKLEDLLLRVADQYGKFYPELNSAEVIGVFKDEENKFVKTLNNGLKALDRLELIDGISAFKIFESHGLPYEIIKELGGDKAANLTREDFDAEFKKHQEISRAGQERKFGGHGLILDTGELRAGDEEELKIVTRLHTATHMLQQALREVLGPGVSQMGSDITAARTRFDFSFPRKLTPEEIAKVEEVVNSKIKEDLPVQKLVLPKAEAEKTGALYFFKEKYPDPVNVYFVGRNLETAFSKEFCGGPHVAHTGEIGVFKIVKEEAVGAGVRRIKATAG